MSGKGIAVGSRPLFLQQCFSQYMNQMKDNSRTCQHRSQRSLGNRSFPPVLWTERLHAASATSLIHHCLFPFPPQFYRGLHSWPRGKTDWNGNRVALSKADVWPEATGKNCDLSFDKMGRIRLICLMISNMFSTIQQHGDWHYISRFKVPLRHCI